MSKNISASAPLWKWPLILERYDRTPSLSCFELIALKSWNGTSSTRNDLRKSLSRLYRPLEDVKNMSTQSNWPSGLSRAQTLILLEVKRTQLCYWAWGQAKWLDLFSRLSPEINTPLYLIAVAYLLCDFRLVHRVTCRYFFLSSLAQFVFSRDLFWQECNRLHQALQDIGYGKINLKNNFPSVVATIMLENRNPYLESFNTELLERTRQNYMRQSRSVGKVSHGLAALGILSNPLRMRSYVPWKEKSLGGIAPEWAGYCRRWRETSILQPQTREGNYSFTLRTGLWLARNHPEITHPAQWTVETCADFMAALNRLKVGEWELQSSDNINRQNLGEPLSANSKRSVLNAVRGFFRDIQRWGWVKLKFNPIYHLATPTSILRLCGPNPRAVDDTFWLKLVWASLNLTPDDKLSEIWYPIEMLRALSVVWTHVGLRQNEIARLHVGCARPQSDPIVDDKTGKTVAPGTLCYLDVPAGKTFTAFTKPVNAIVRHYIGEWETIRPEQPPLLDSKTGERVRFLFQYRGKLLGSTTINRTIIPMLCAKAGLPLEDSRGRITSHRGRASAVPP